MLVQCHSCQAKVAGKVVGQYETGFNDDPSDQRQYSLVVCPECSSCLLARSSWLDYDQTNERHVWSDAIREWPSPDSFSALDYPEIVAVSVAEARRCYEAGCFLAAAVMCGRALEGVCVDFKTKSKNLSTSLDELLKRDIIDKKLHAWGHAIRMLRNVAAHATDEKISQKDAHDLLEFTRATCEYVFVLTKRFGEFMERNKERKKAKAFSPTPPEITVTSKEFSKGGEPKAGDGAAAQ